MSFCCILFYVFFQGLENHELFPNQPYFDSAEEFAIAEKKGKAIRDAFRLETGGKVWSGIENLAKVEHFIRIRGNGEKRVQYQTTVNLKSPMWISENLSTVRDLNKRGFDGEISWKESKLENPFGLEIRPSKTRLIRDWYQRYEILACLPDLPFLLVGEEKDCWVVDVLNPLDNLLLSRLWIDKVSMRLQNALVWEEKDYESKSFIPKQVFYRDFQKVEGVLYPFEIEEIFECSRVLRRYEEIRLNPELPAEGYKEPVQKGSPISR